MIMMMVMMIVMMVVVIFKSLKVPFELRPTSV